jgi:hypothetical protein
MTIAETAASYRGSGHRGIAGNQIEVPDVYEVMADLSFTTVAALAAALLALGLLVWLLAGPGLSPRPDPDDGGGTDDAAAPRGDLRARASGGAGAAGADPDR